MQIIVNGQHREVSTPSTIGQLLQQLELEPQKVVVELNRNILTAEALNTELQEGDTLELIQFVGGG